MASPKMTRCARSPSFEPRHAASTSTAAIGPRPFHMRRAPRSQPPGIAQQALSQPHYAASRALGAPQNSASVNYGASQPAAGGHSKDRSNKDLTTGGRDP